ncbi:MAG: hypothetical protein RKP20_13805 [Candidatus Competibacter sp.]|nr:hypothetical protein [Candidatus Competibacter sp.]
MDKRRFGKILMVLAGLVLLAESPPVAAQQWVVVAAEGVSLQPGTLLDGKRPVKLAEGARLTLLAEDGKTLKLTGPYAGTPEKSGDATDVRGENLTVIAGLLQGQQQSTSMLGAMRGNAARLAPTADLIDMDNPGARCLYGDPVVLWRGNPAASEQVTLADAQGARLASFTWPTGEARLAVPDRYFENGKSYLLQRTSRPVTLEVRKSPSLPDNPAALVAWMASNGCKAQALSVLGGL